MKSHKKLIVFLIISIVLLGILIFPHPYIGNEPGWPMIYSSWSSDPKEIDAIKTAIKMGDLVQDNAETSSDLGLNNLAEYKKIYINQPDVQLDQSRLDYVQKFRNIYGDKGTKELEGTGLEKKSSNENGWLAFMTAMFLDRKAGTEGLGNSTATIQHRDIVNDPHTRSTSTITLANYSFKFISVAIDHNGTQAIVVFDDGAVTTHAFLVKSEGNWKIAGIRAINVHY